MGRSSWDKIQFMCLSGIGTMAVSEVEMGTVMAAAVTSVEFAGSTIDDERRDWKLESGPS